jgi:UDP-2,4-diacetamido-2,4,6-trideoxy-beta-L-altropyranose hydrolase
MTPVVFRADASIVIGSGHVERCATLAGELTARGADVRFLCREMPGHYCDWLEQRGFDVRRLHGENVEIDDDIAQCRAALAEIGIVDWLVVDHYGLDARWETALRPMSRNILVIDDKADRAHDCDLMLDQNIAVGTADPYAGLLPCDAKRLLGPHYALLRPEFSAARATSSLRQTRDGGVRRILVCFGGSDPQRHTVATLHALRAFASRLERIDVVVGRANPDQAAIVAACAELPGAVIHSPANDMAALLAGADLAIGAGGTMNWERACLGVPTLAFAVAENQSKLLAALFETGCAIGQECVREPDEQIIVGWINCMLESPSLLRGLAQRSASLVDGLGTRRVADAMLGNAPTLPIQQSPLVDVLCSDLQHPIRSHLETWCSQHRDAKLCAQASELRGGDFLFLISCQELIPAAVRARYRYCLVAHASDLPRGRGMSPHVWQIIEGRNELTVSLLEAAEPFDTGSIWTKQSFRLEGHELCDEINSALFARELALMDWALIHHDSVSPQAQAGVPSYFKRRTPEDSRLDPMKSIAEQFELLRIADPIRYPAFFDFRGYRYQISLSKRERGQE